MSKYSYCRPCLLIGGYCGCCSGDMFNKYGESTKVLAMYSGDEGNFEFPVIVPAGKDVGFYLDSKAPVGTELVSWSE